MEAMDLHLQITEVRQSFSCGKTKEESWRRSQLQALLSLLVENESDIFAALSRDLGKHPVESFRDEVGTSIKTVTLALKCLRKWMAGRKASLPIAAFPSTAEVIPEPLGVVLIIASWNFPFGLSLEPLIGAVAAGNAAVLKPSELAPASSSLLARLIRSYLDATAIKVIEGGAWVGEQLLHEKWDKIFFTGSTRVARRIMSAAAENLTPVVLELGGKCPAVVDALSGRLAKQVATKRILSSKFGTCAGQACIGIDYIIVEEKFCPTLVQLLKDGIADMFGKNPRESKSIARIINENHFSRLGDMLDDPLVKRSIVHGGALDRENLFVEPTILIDPPLKASIMTDEIFGPLLPLITVNKIEESIGFINSLPRPLAIYAFTQDESLKSKLLRGTSSGSIVFNDAIIQYAADSLPFGGVGESGFGRYHGKFSFDTFSHEKVVARRNFIFDIWFRYPPWNGNSMNLLRAGYLYEYVRIVLILLGFNK
ncbi:aldehyde dehydrogenase, partial [Genlisea aurea]